jgi:fatty acid amide hydrolase 2
MNLVKRRSSWLAWRMLKLSGTELARLIRERSVTSAEVVEAHIDQIERVNPALNAVVATRFDEARGEAARADLLTRSVAPDQLPPLHGVPCTIKESFALAGMPNTGGLVARAGQPAGRDAVAVSRLRSAGAIPLGVTNVSELCMWLESDNRVYGRTNNPYDHRRIVGGSSGGEGAIIAAGGSPFGLGSDIAGSIRLPSFFNGVFGHKPTGGLVPNTGQFPVSQHEALRYLTAGPIARRAADLMPLLKILAGPDGEDPSCVPSALGDPASVRVSELTVLDVEDNGVLEVSEDVREGQRRAVAALAERGARVVRARIEGLRASLQIWSSMMTAAGGESFSSMLGGGTPIRALHELARWALGRSPHTFPALGLAIVERIPKLLPKQVQRFVEQGRALRAELVERIGPRGVMLYPTYPTVAPVHHKPLFPPWRWIYTPIINVMELPSTQVPLGLNGEGLPLGVQVVSVHNNDHVTIAVALELERALGGWVFPPLAAE